MLRKRLQNRAFLEKADAENLQDFAHAAFDLQFFLDDGHEHVHADGDPNLRLDGVVGGSVERLDPQVLFDPLEEQFYLPAAAVELGDGQGRQGEVVGQEDEMLVDIGRMIAHPAKRVGVESRTLGAAQYNRAVAAQAGGFVHWTIAASRVIHVAFGTRHKESQALSEGVQTGKVDVPAVHEVEGAGLYRQEVQRPDVRHRTAGNMHKTR